MVRLVRALVALWLLSVGMAQATPAPGNAVAVVAQYPAFCLSDPGLTDALRVRVSPDGQHVYVLGKYLSVWERQPNGALLFVEEDQSVTFPTGNIPSTSLAKFTIAPDGAHLYAVTQNTVRVFARDGVTGEVSLVETLVQGMGGITGLGTVRSVAVSPDGANVYVAANDGSGGNVVVFARDAGTGMLTFLETQTNGVGGVADLDVVVDALVMPGGEHVYVGAFDVTAGFTGNVIVGRFDRDMGTGLLSFVGTTIVRTAGSNTSGETVALRASPDGTSLYLSSVYHFLGTTDRELQSISRDPVTGNLALVGTPLALAPADLEVAPDGNHAYYGGGRFSRDAVTGVLSVDDPTDIGDGGGLHRDTLAIAPDGLSIYVRRAVGAVESYARDVVSGDHTFVQAVSQQLAAPAHLALSPDEEHLYATCSKTGRGDTLVVLDRDPPSGDVTPIDSLRHALDVPDGLRIPRSVIASADGENVYVVARTNDGACAVTTFDRDGISGLLTWTDTLPIPGSGASTETSACFAGPLLEGPDGGNLYLPVQITGFPFALVNFERDLVDGTLTLAGSVPLPAFGNGLTISPDGARLVVSTWVDVIVSVARDPVDGSLGASVSSFIETGELASPLFATNGDFWLVDDFPGALWSLDYDPTTGVTDVVFKEARAPANLAKVVLDEASGHLLGIATSKIVTFRRDVSGAAFLADEIAIGAGAATDVVLATGGPEAYVALRNAPMQLARVVRAPACATSPMVGCRTSTEPGAGLLFAKRPGNPARSKLKWKLIRGEAAVPADFGDQATTTGQVLCLYDASGSGDAVVAAEARPGGTCGSRPCWKTTKTGFIYKASLPERQPDGVAKMSLKAGLAGKSSIKVIVAGGALGLPTAAFVPPVVVQLQDTNGSCWEATVSAPAINEPGKLKGRPD